jgi:hypothetical protein
MLYAGLYLYPLGHDKAVGYRWSGYSIAHALLSSITQMSWPVALFAGPGLILLWQRDRVQAMYWSVQTAVWLGSFVVLPMLLSFHSAYAYALSLPVFVLAAVTIGEIADHLVERGRTAAGLTLLALLLLDLPSLASYYEDGSRHDFRAAANWIAERMRPNDIIVAVQGDKLGYYRPELEGRWYRLPFREIPQWLATKRPKNGRVWIVITGSRTGMNQPWGEWAEKAGRLQTTIVHPRFDYHEYPIFILLEDDLKN